MPAARTKKTAGQTSAHLPTPRVFVSATSGDLRSVREVVKAGLLSIDCQPVEQGNFPPDYRNVEQMLTEKIASCHAVIHLVGVRYGAEPDPSTLPEGEPRRSYAQLEADIARELERKLFVFVCPENFPYDQGAEPEPPELQALQAIYRQTVEADNSQLRNALLDHQEAGQKIRELRVHLDELRDELHAELEREKRSHKRSLVYVLVTMLVLALGVGAYFSYRESVRTKQNQLMLTAYQEMEAAVKEMLSKQNQEKQKIAEANANPLEKARILDSATKLFKRGQEQASQFAENVVKLTNRPDASNYAKEFAAQILEEDPDLLSWLASQEDSILAEAKKLQSTHLEKSRDLLQVLLNGASYAELQGNYDLAENWIRRSIAADTEWLEPKEMLVKLLINSIGPMANQRQLPTEEALLRLEGAHDQLNILLEKDSNNIVWSKLLSNYHELIGDIQHKQGNLDKAETAYSESLKIRTDIHTLKPEDNYTYRSLSVAYNKLGEIARSRNIWNDAKKNYQEAFNIRQKLSKSDPKNLQWKRDLAISHIRLGITFQEIYWTDTTNQSMLNISGDHFKESYKVFRELHEIDSDNLQYQLDLSIGYDYLGDHAKENNDFETAHKHYKKGQELAQNLTDNHPNRTLFQVSLAILSRKLGQNALKEKNYPYAIKQFRKALHIRRYLAGIDPSNIEWLNGVFAVYYWLALAHEESGRPDLAIRYWRQSYEAINQIDERGFHISPRDRYFQQEVKKRIDQYDGANKTSKEQLLPSN